MSSFRHFNDGNNILKLEGVSNYETWHKQMSNELRIAKLWCYVTGDRKRPEDRIIGDISTLSPKHQTLKYNVGRYIDEWDDNADACVGHILLAVSITVQNDCDAKLATFPDKNSWDPPTLWEYLKERYTKRG